ncbi:B12-binding domain-containing radical SAM protein [Fundidesulfovibrio magnetotacticus]|uniref:B12-binding domain-containing radical SAM protein n=1 Tax=Fundidesulfovibrio magnetotacticus TaxID=2730080 RepID=UPI0015637FB8|nr:radical SAM protein [Fundidesulfovibrio magnetotacticus]
MATILFLQRDGYEAFGPMYLSAALKARGHRADVIVQAEEGRGFWDAVGRAGADVVAFSIMSGVHQWAADTALEAKRRFGLRVVAGGPHCTFFPEFIREPGIDALCRGEAEDALADYLDALDAGGDGAGVPGFLVKTASGVAEADLYPLRADLDELPPPDRTLYAARYPALAAGSGAEVMPARGCPYSCSFCYNKLIRGLYKGKGPYIRRHSPERVLEEMESLLRERRGSLTHFSFVDDLFVQDRPWLEEFLAGYARRVGLPYMCSVRANLVDESLVDLLARSGCRMVSFGVESGDDALRNDVLGKKISRAQIERTAALLTARGIVFSTFNMFNLPGETLDKALETLRLNQALGPLNHPWSGLLQPYRGTGVYDQALALGLIGAAESGARRFDSPTVRQPDTEALDAFSAYFYWMSRHPALERLLLPLARRRVRPLERLASLAASLARHTALNRPFQGWGALATGLSAGLKRIKSYL